jgi:phosphatidylinositol alpha-1,6-mannosyltransferase
LSRPRLFLACNSVGLDQGGAARAGRLVARAVAEECRAGRLEASGAALCGAGGAGDGLVPLRDCRGSRARFAWHTWRAARDHSHFLYNFVGMARAHSRLPWRRRPFAAFLLGIDVWEQARADRVRWARRADLLLSISAHTRDRADRAHGGLGHARVCWLATEEDEPAMRRPRHRPPTVLIVGRIDERENYKGHDELLSAWPRVAREVGGARLLVIGDGSGLGRLKARAADLPGCDVEFRGFVPEAKMQDVWDEADVFAMPSRGEGFGLVYIEAMRQGLPVVASVHDAGSEVNLHGVTGFNVDLGRPADLEGRLIELLSDAALRVRLGEAGRQRWAEHFRYSAFRERFVNVLRPWLNGGA